ncbi:MAG: DUF2213 domain-containing protein [Pseudodesulfovibrio sp.]|uniref:DUF2213 domain-containing protein n=1 Tax=Pseudodesulfovibrio sp. TaxID=2035812 RepID=UPI003D0BC98C
MAETREGFLVCYAVPIARIGFMEYAPHEVPVEPDENGRVRVERTEAEVFHPDAMASYEGKPATVNHPKEDVTPVTWKGVAVGHAQNIRRGEGEAADLLLADLVITDQDAIALIRGGLREVSCGYDAEYEQVAPGHGRQRNIRGNHVALVNRARCGSRCRINDNSEDIMPKEKKQTTFLDTLAGFLKKPEVRKMLDEEGGDPPQPEKPDVPATDEDRMAALEARLNELEIQVRNLKPTEDEDPADEPGGEQPAEPDATGTTDAAPVRTVDADTKRRAEYLVPGMVVQTSDQACAVQRAALRTAMTRDKAIGDVVTGALRGSTLDGCDCVTLDAAFLAASEVAKAKNNGKTADALKGASTKDFGKATTPADINRMNREFHKKGA